MLSSLCKKYNSNDIGLYCTGQEMKFCIKDDFFSKCHQIHSFLIFLITGYQFLRIINEQQTEKQKKEFKKFSKDYKYLWHAT